MDYCNNIVIDLDLHDKGLTDLEIFNSWDTISFAIMDHIKKRYKIESNNILREFSGRGFHIWIKLKPLTELNICRSFGRAIELRIKEVFTIDCEVFPKHEIVGTNGYGCFIKLPLGINRNNGAYCPILDNFDLSEQGEGYIIPNYIRPIKEKRYDSSFEVNIIHDKEDQFFYDQLKPCIRGLIDTKMDGNIGNLLRVFLVNSLLFVGAPLETRINALRNQNDFDKIAVKYHVLKCEEGVIRKGNPLLPSCKKLRKLGLCPYKRNNDCPFIIERYKKRLEEKEVRI